MHTNLKTLLCISFPPIPRRVPGECPDNQFPTEIFDCGSISARIRGVSNIILTLSTAGSGRPSVRSFVSVFLVGEEDNSKYIRRARLEYASIKRMQVLWDGSTVGGHSLTSQA
jgi:hypothetical protein